MVFEFNMFEGLLRLEYIDGGIFVKIGKKKKKKNRELVGLIGLYVNSVGISLLKEVNV